MKYILTIIVAMMTAQAALAEFSYLSRDDRGDLGTKEFATENIEQPDYASKIHYSYKLVEWNDWASLNGGVNKKVLNLFEGFKPREDKPVIMYIGKATVVLNKPADQISGKAFMSPATIATLNPEDVIINPTKDLVAAKDIITNEKSSHYRNPPPPAHWCDGANVFCLKSKFYLPEEVAGAFEHRAKSAGSPYLDMRSENQFKFQSQNEITNATDLIALTGITTQPKAVATEDSYWFSHMVAFAKTVAVFQPHPKNPNQTVATVYMVFAIEHSAWDAEHNFLIKKVKVSRIMLGLEAAFKQPSGLMCGLPCFTQDTIANLANLFNR